jgi:hypothetical protein
MIFPNLFVSDFIPVLIGVVLSWSSLSGLAFTLQIMSALLSIVLVPFSLALFASSTVMWYFSVVSSAVCLVNVFPPPHFDTDQIADSHADGFSSVRIESLVHKLIQSFYVCFRKI